MPVGPSRLSCPRRSAEDLLAGNWIIVPRIFGKGSSLSDVSPVVGCLGSHLNILLKLLNICRSQPPSMITRCTFLPNQVPDKMICRPLTRIMGHMTRGGSGGNGRLVRNNVLHKDAAFGAVPPTGSPRSVQWLNVP